MFFGGEIYFQEKSKHKNIYQYYITCSEATDMLKTLLGFLISKKEQAEFAIKFHETKECLSSSMKKEFYLKMKQLKIWGR